jgi:type I protein arginine methyltransferase
VYSVAGYGRMIADRTRVAAYTEALQRAVRPGCTVLEIGTGTGFFAMLACRLGAGRVYAVEPDGVIQIARETALANGCADRIQFIQDLSTRIELPEPVDVIVSDLRGVLPWFGHHIATIIHAREQHLTSGGILIPEHDKVWAAVVEMPEFYSQHVGHQPGDTCGFDMSVARRIGVSRWARAQATPEQLLTIPHHWATLDYRTITDNDVRGEIDWIAARSGIAHGLVVWFETILTENVGFSNAPGEQPLLYGTAFFPLQEPVNVSAGDAIAVSLQANLVEDDYVWRWKTRVTSAQGVPQTKAEFSQSTATIGAHTLDSLRRGAASYVPVLHDRGQLDRFILSQMDGSRPIGEIAEALTIQFPKECPTWEDALEAVGELSRRYSQ